MDLTTVYFLTTVLVLILEQEAFSISGTDPGSERGLQAEIVARPARREKRCSCENLKDKECVYFCHIGIVWVNTPGQVVPYGVGSFPVRLRREVRRCECANSRDSECLQFCTASPLLTEQVGIARLRRMLRSKSAEKNKSGTFDKRNRIQVQKT